MSCQACGTIDDLDCVCFECKATFCLPCYDIAEDRCPSCDKRGSLYECNNFEDALEQWFNYTADGEQYVVFRYVDEDRNDDADDDSTDSIGISTSNLQPVFLNAISPEQAFLKLICSDLPADLHGFPGHFHNGFKDCVAKLILSYYGIDARCMKNIYAFPTSSENRSRDW